eukprot:TRINITY_DN3600_c2_g2_i1.p1 TRINITY_DN3600_c2_g2~~TRINITY_DN3600_c2_g2_i1.p1  ORF type:complete len:3131 (-),score=735.81 TRINITY_DN3600_c2_g2_i1:171-9563(-)
MINSLQEESKKFLDNTFILSKYVPAQNQTHDKPKEVGLVDSLFDSLSKYVPVPMVQKRREVLLYLQETYLENRYQVEQEKTVTTNNLFSKSSITTWLVKQLEDNQLSDIATNFKKTIKFTGPHGKISPDDIASFVAAILERGNSPDFSFLILLLLVNQENLPIDKFQLHLKAFKSMSLILTPESDSVEDDVPELRQERAIELQSIFGFDINLCIKALESRGDDVNSAANYIFEAQDQIEQEIESENQLRELKRNEHLQLKDKRDQDLQNYNQNERVKEIKQRSLYSNCDKIKLDVVSQSKTHGNSVPSHDLLLFICSHLDTLMVEYESGIQLLPTSRLSILSESHSYSYHLLSYAILILMEYFDTGKKSKISIENSYILTVLVKLLYCVVITLNNSSSDDVEFGFLINIFNELSKSTESKLLFEDQSAEKILLEYIKKTLDVAHTVTPAKILLDDIVQLIERDFSNPNVDDIKKSQVILQRFQSDLSQLDSCIDHLVIVMDKIWKMYSTHIDKIVKQISDAKWEGKITDHLVDYNESIQKDSGESQFLFYRFFKVLDAYLLYSVQNQKKMKEFFEYGLSQFISTVKQVIKEIDVLPLSSGKKDVLQNVFEFIKSTCFMKVLPFLSIGLTFGNANTFKNVVLDKGVPLDDFVVLLEKVDNLVMTGKEHGIEMKWLEDVLEILTHTSILLVMCIVHGKMTDTTKAEKKILESNLFKRGLQSEKLDERYDTWIKNMLSGTGYEGRFLHWIKMHVHESNLFLPNVVPAKVAEVYVFCSILYLNSRMNHAIEISEKLNEKDFDIANNRPPTWILEAWRAVQYMKRDIMVIRQKIASENGKTKSYDEMFKVIEDKSLFLLKLTPHSNENKSLRSSRNQWDANNDTPIIGSETSKAILEFLKDESDMSRLRELILQRNERCKLREEGLFAYKRILINMKSHSVIVVLNQLSTTFIGKGFFMVHYTAGLNSSDSVYRNRVSKAWEELYGCMVQKMKECTDQNVKLAYLTAWNCKLESQDLKFVLSTDIFTILQEIFDQHSSASTYQSRGSFYSFSENIKSVKHEDVQQRKVYDAALTLFKLLSSQIVLLSGADTNQNDNEVDQSVFKILFSEIDRAVSMIGSPQSKVNDTKIDCQQIVDAALQFSQSDCLVISKTLSLSSTSFSTSFWFKMNAHKDCNIIKCGSSKDTWSVVLCGDQVEFRVFSTEGSYEFAQSVFRMVRKVWVHVTCVCDSKSLKIYINGKLDCDKVLEHPMNQEDYLSKRSDLINVGMVAGSEPGFVGMLSDIKYVSRILNESEIHLMFDNGPTIEGADEYSHQLLTLIDSVAATPKAKAILIYEQYLKTFFNVFKIGTYRVQVMCLHLFRKILGQIDPKQTFEVLNNMSSSKFFLGYLSTVIGQSRSDSSEDVAMNSGENILNIILELVITFRSLINVSAKWKDEVSELLEDVFVQFLKLKDEDIHEGNPILHTALASVYIIGGQQDVMRVGRYTYLMGIKSKILSYNPSSRKAKVLVRDFFGFGDDWKAVGIRPWEVDPSDEIVFLPSMKNSHEKYIQLVIKYYASENWNIKDFHDKNFLHLHLITRCLRSFVNMFYLEKSLIETLKSSSSTSTMKYFVNNLLTVALQPISVDLPSTKNFEYFATELLKLYHNFPSNNQDTSSTKDNDSTQDVKLTKIETSTKGIISNSVNTKKHLLDALMFAYPDVEKDIIEQAIDSVADEENATSLVNILIEKCERVTFNLFKEKVGDYPLEWIELAHNQPTRNVKELVEWWNTNLHKIKKEHTVDNLEIITDETVEEIFQKPISYEVKAPLSPSPIQPLPNVIRDLCRYEKALQAVYARKLIVHLLESEFSSIRDDIVKNILAPQQFVKLLQLVVFRDDDNNNAESVLNEFISKEILNNLHVPQYVSILEEMVEVCSKQFIKIAASIEHGQYALKKPEEMNDKQVLYTPSIHFISWVLNLLLSHEKSSDYFKEHMDQLKKVYENLSFGLNTSLADVKQHIFHLLSNILRLLVKWKLPKKVVEDYISILPVERIKRMGMRRLQSEQYDGSSHVYTPFLNSLLSVIASISFAEKYSEEDLQYEICFKSESFSNKIDLSWDVISKQFPHTDPKLSAIYEIFGKPTTRLIESSTVEEPKLVDEDPNGSNPSCDDPSFVTAIRFKLLLELNRNDESAKKEEVPKESPKPESGVVVPDPSLVVPPNNTTTNTTTTKDTSAPPSGSSSSGFKSYGKGSSTSSSVSNLNRGSEYMFQLTVKDSNNKNSKPSTHRHYARTLGYSESFLLCNDPSHTSASVKVTEDRLHVQSVLDDTRVNPYLSDLSDTWAMVLGDVQWSSGVHYWEVSVDYSIMGSASAYIGIANVNDFKLDGITGIGFMNYRVVYDWRDARNLIYGEFFGTGDVIGMTLDLDRGRISYSINGIDLGTTFYTNKNLIGETWAPILGLKAGVSLSLLPERTFHLASPCVDYTCSQLNDVTSFLLNYKYETIQNSMCFLHESYQDLLQWVKPTHVTCQIKGGFTISLKMQTSFGLSYGDKIVIGSIANKPTIVMGEYNGKLWAKAEDEKEAWFIPESEIPNINHISSSEEETKKSDIYVPKSFQEYVKRATDKRWTLAIDRKITHFINRLGKKCGPFNVSPHVLYDKMKDQDYLQLSDSKEAVGGGDAGASVSLLSSLLCRSSVLRTLNTKLRLFLQFVDFKNCSHEGSICYLLKSFKKVVFLGVKLEMMESLFETTRYRARPPDDDWGYPASMVTVRIDRKLSLEKKPEDEEEDNKEEDYFGSDSVFIQAHTAIVENEDTVLRQSYVGKSDDGQKRSFLVEFIGEGVQDNGGPYRELFGEITRELQGGKLSLFSKSPNNQDETGRDQGHIIPNHLRNNVLVKNLFSFVGMLMAIAMRSNVTMPFELTNLFWKYMVDEDFNVDDLDRINTKLVQYLQELENTPESEFNEKYEGVCFSIVSGKEEVELIPNGKSTKLVWEQRKEYVNKVIQFELKKYNSQLDAIKKGFGRILPVDYFKIFTWKELEMVVCGDPELDIQSLKETTIYEEVSPEEEHIKFFWKVLEELSPEQHSQFLKFVWARSRMPLSSGGPQRSLKIQSPPPNSYDNPDLFHPTSRTCFFSISLPRYSSYDIAKEKITYAIKHCKEMDNDYRM